MPCEYFVHMGNHRNEKNMRKKALLGNSAFPLVNHSDHFFSANQSADMANGRFQTKWWSLSTYGSPTLWDAGVDTKGRKCWSLFLFGIPRSRFGIPRSTCDLIRFFFGDQTIDIEGEKRSVPSISIKKANCEEMVSLSNPLYFFYGEFGALVPFTIRNRRVYVI